MSKINLEVLSAEEFYSGMADLMTQIRSALVEHQDRWLTELEARNMWATPPAHNTFIKYAKLYNYPSKKEGGRTFYLRSGIMQVSKSTDRRVKEIPVVTLNPKSNKKII